MPCGDVYEDIPVFNRDLLLRRLGGDEDVAREVLRDIAGSLPVRIAQCRAALAREDRTMLQEMAHTIKGSAATAGAERVARLATDLHGLSRDPTTTPARLRDALEMLEACVDELLQLGET